MSHDWGLVMKSEHAANTPWQPLDSTLRRYTLASPDEGPRLVGPSHDVGMVHTERASLFVRVGGGHLVAERPEVLRRLLAASEERLRDVRATPSHYIEDFIAWLEYECKEGFLVRAYITLTLMVAVGDGEVWTWHVGPNGVLRRSSAGMLQLVGTDARMPALMAVGMKLPERFEESAVLRDKMDSIFCIGTPLGYERNRHTLAEGELVWALDRGLFPFGPWPEGGLPADRVWSMDGGWNHGLPGVGIVMGRGSFTRSDIPRDWTVREVPFE